METDELANYNRLSLENKILVLAQAEALVFAEKTIEKRLAAENVAKNSKKTYRLAMGDRPDAIDL